MLWDKGESGWRRVTPTFCFCVDGHGPVHEARVQAPRRAGQARDSGLPGGEEVLQTHFLGALTAFINGKA